MSSWLEELHDIEGLDSISAWPLAVGWWVLLGVAVLLLFALGWFLMKWLAFRRSWRSDTFQKLTVLEKNLSEATARDTVITLSEYLRRISLKRFPRKECAGLVGTAWLQWLAKHDPKGFDWETKGTLLVEMPYAPGHGKLGLATQDVKDLIRAVRDWV